MSKKCRAYSESKIGLAPADNRKAFYAGWEAATALRAAIEQEPVAWLFQHEETGLTECVDTQQVDWGFEKNNPRWQKIAPLYTAPPQRQWQGLTKDEVDEWELPDSPTVFEFAKFIEAKLKGKNT